MEADKGVDRVPKVYFFGLSTGNVIKIGYTVDPLSTRKRSLLAGQMTKLDLHLLAAVRGSRTHEAELKAHFAHLKDGANSTETFSAGEDLLEYINWLRQQWWVYLNEDDQVDELPAWPMWSPQEDRRAPFAIEDPADLIPRHRSYNGPLAGTLWDRMSTPSKSGDDFYTPSDIVEAAAEAMGGIDLDPASHWQANRVHRIPNYYHLHRSAHQNPWFGRVWLNPPYGDNAPWFERIKMFWDNGEIKQLCMISPVWAFTTVQAKPIISRSSAMILLTPTPTFWGHPKQREGTNHPHAIVYLGSRVREFHQAFKGRGIPMILAPQVEDNGSAP